MAYQHGIGIKENATSIPAPIAGTAGLQVVFGTAPVNLLADPCSAVNKLIIAYSLADAVAELGYSTDYESYTLCQSMDANFRLFGVAPVIFCNVLDPAKHKTTQEETECELSGGQATLKVTGMLLDTVTVKAGDTKISKDNYITSFDDDGYVVVTLTAGQTSVATGKIKISGEKLNPSAVTEADIIGGYNAATGEETGIELVRQVYPKFSMTPGLLLAPGWSHNASVAATLAAKCNEINGVFTCECLIDISTENAKKYTDVKKEKDDIACISKHAILCWPMVEAMGKAFYYSSVLAACIAHADINNDDVPSLSPSNIKMPVSGAVIKDGTEVLLDQTQANDLNAVGVVTVLNSNGWRSWGNNTACYPDNIDPKDRWIACRRFFSWHGNSFIHLYCERVDNPANYRLIEALVDDENVRGNSLVAQGKAAGVRIEYNSDENPASQVINGKVKFHQYLAPYTPAEYIENTLEFDRSMLETALSGGEE